MLPDVTIPASLAGLLVLFRSCFTAPTYQTFTGLVTGFLAQTRRRTVCGMLLGAGLERLWHHARAHRFFAGARWCADAVGLVLADLVVTLLPEGAPITVVVDDTLFKRSGKKVFGAAWHHDGAAKGPKPIGYGNCWVVAGIVVDLPFCSRPVCLPVLARLWRPRRTGKIAFAREMVELLAAAHPDRVVHAVGDAAYVGEHLRGLGRAITWTSRLKVTSVLHELAPARTGKSGRPRTKGARLGRTRDGDDRGYGLPLVTTDLTSPAEDLVARYAARWSIEVAFSDARQVLGVGEARNRSPRAVERTVPFGLVCLSLVTVWYATAGHAPADVAEHRARARWYTTKTEPSFADMTAKLRRVIIAARFRHPSPHQATHEQIHAVHLAWAAADL